MADTVSIRTLLDNGKQVVVHLTNISDGTGEAAVIKIDKSAIGVTTDGAEADSLDIEAVRWCIQGFTSVRLLWDHTTDDLALALSGSGYDDFLGADGRRGTDVAPLLTDPRSSGGTGDILLTTAGASSGATYDITLWCRKAAS